MAGELLTNYETGKTVYVVVLDGSGRAWNTSTSAFETIDTANWANYAVALTEQQTSGVYVGDFPSGIATSGRYRAIAYEQLGGAPASGDLAVAGGVLDWNGALEVHLANAGDGFDVEAGINLRQAVAIVLAAVAGKTNGFLGAKAATGATFLAPDGSSTRITADTDEAGNRLQISLSPPA